MSWAFVSWTLSVDATINRAHQHAHNDLATTMGSPQYNRARFNQQVPA